jgi:hypothetical protein
MGVKWFATQRGQNARDPTSKIRKFDRLNHNRISQYQTLILKILKDN